jgi:hypothetical protein
VGEAVTARVGFSSESCAAALADAQHPAARTTTSNAMTIPCRAIDHCLLIFFLLLLLEVIILLAAAKEGGCCTLMGRMED